MRTLKFFRPGFKSCLRCWLSQVTYWDAISSCVKWAQGPCWIQRLWVPLAHGTCCCDIKTYAYLWLAGAQSTAQMFGPLSHLLPFPLQPGLSNIASLLRVQKRCRVNWRVLSLHNPSKLWLGRHSHASSSRITLLFVWDSLTHHLEVMHDQNSVAAGVNLKAASSYCL